MAVHELHVLKIVNYGILKCSNLVVGFRRFKLKFLQSLPPNPYANISKKA